MSSPDIFSNVDSTKPPNKPESIDEDHEDGICPSCDFVLEEHSSKQILNCALKEVHLVLGVEKK